MGKISILDRKSLIALDWKSMLYFGLMSVLVAISVILDGNYYTGSLLLLISYVQFYAMYKKITELEISTASSSSPKENGGRE